MITYEGKTYLTTKEACRVMDRSIEALRQLIHRKRLNPQKIGSRLYLDNEEVMNYFPNKFNLPKFELIKPSEREDDYYSFEHVRGILNFTPTYLRCLIRNGKLKAFCTSDGQILVPKSSLDQFMGVTSNGDSQVDI